MTHTGPLPDSAGTFRPACNELHTCRKCGKKTARCELWESNCGAYDDVRYTCTDCGFVSWVDGIDS